MRFITALRIYPYCVPTTGKIVKKATSNFILSLNAFALFGCSLLVAVAFSLQILLAELPCALCNLQRLEFLLFGSGILTVLLHPKIYRMGYLLSGVSAIIGACTAITQVFIHILPTDEGGVGSPIFGFHLYAWCFVIFMAAAIYVLVLMSLHTESTDRIMPKNGLQSFKTQKPIVKFIITFYVLISIVATSSAFVANGFGPFLEGGQQKYWLLEVIKNPGTTVTQNMLMQK